MKKILLVTLLLTVLAACENPDKKKGDIRYPKKERESKCRHERIW